MTKSIASDHCAPLNFTAVQWYSSMKIFPSVVDTAVHADYQTIAKEKQQLQEDLDKVKHMMQAKDQQISELKKELKQARLEQKCKWRCVIHKNFYDDYTHAQTLY